MLSGGQSYTLGGNFVLQSDGAKSASLDITSDDPDEGNVSIALSGTGVVVPVVSGPVPDVQDSSGGGGYGCIVKSGTAFDPLMPLLILISGLYLWLRRESCSADKVMH